MYIPKLFDEVRPEAIQQLVQAYPLALLVAHTDAGLEANHIPVVYDEASEDQRYLRGHIAKANQLWKNVADQSEMLAVFQGPSQYISPNWYPSKAKLGEVVPTWNYAVVHMHGRIRWIHDEDWLIAFLTRMTDLHESTQPTPWQFSDAPESYRKTMLQAIVGFELKIERVQGKFKLSQNRSPEDHQGVLEGLTNAADLHAVEMAKFMQCTKQRTEN